MLLYSFIRMLKSIVALGVCAVGVVTAYGGYGGGYGGGFGGGFGGGGYGGYGGGGCDCGFAQQQVQVQLPVQQFAQVQEIPIQAQAQGLII